MQNFPPDDFDKTIPGREPGNSQTILPGGQNSGRTSPPPLYPEVEDFYLPQAVEEDDWDGTRVSPVALQVTVNPRPPAGRPPVGPNQNAWGCFVRGLVAALFGLVGLLIVGAALLVFGYYSIASSLPSVADLRERSAKFETTRILDRNGHTLYEILDPTAGRRTYVPIQQISPYLVAATIATEDKGFYTHAGFDPIAILRALWQNYTTGGNGPGASTITQQLARALLLSPEERVQRTYTRKIREIILAAEITRRFSKDEILELYLNEIYYGNLAYGIEAAAETYFGAGIDGQLTGAPNGRLADDLNLAQASFLAGLPQAPAVYDIHSNREATLNRHRDVLSLMYELSSETNCIRVNHSPEPICVEIGPALEASQAIENLTFPTPNIQMRYPHWVQFIRAQLEAKYDAQTIYRSGFTVITSLDATLQDQAQQIVSAQVAGLAANNASDGALVAIRPSTGEILAMVGSADFYNETISGQVNMAVTQTRQPGSSIKPFTYLAAFEKGWTPATLIWDIPSGFPPSGDPNDQRELYLPVNYDGKFHGPVTVRTALSNSYNIPAVKTLQFVGVYDDPNTSTQDGLVGISQRLGITSLTRTDYGLALTLGGGEVSLLEMTGAYAVIANGGLRVPPVAILKVTDNTGQVIDEYQLPAGEQALRPEHAYLMSSILSDYEARRPMFGAHPVINLPFQAAAKTGTTNDFRDNWTMGYTPDLAVGVWVGNADYTPMQNTTGLSGAAPIWADFMTFAVPQITGGNPTPFNRPAGLTDRIICALSGTEPSQWCPEQRSEVFAADQLPFPASEDFWKETEIDTWTGLQVSGDCPDWAEKKMTFNVLDREVQRWLRKDEQGRALAEELGFERPLYFTPAEKCSGDSSRATLAFENLRDDETLTTPSFVFRLRASATRDFEAWKLEYAPGADPGKDEWRLLTESTAQFPEPGEAYTWDLTQLSPGQYTVRLYLVNREDGFAEKKVRINLNYVAPTASPTPTSTQLPPTETPTVTPPPSETPELPTAAPTELPSETPTP